MSALQGQIHEAEGQCYRVATTVEVMEDLTFEPILRALSKPVREQGSRQLGSGSFLYVGSASKLPDKLLPTS